MAFQALFTITAALFFGILLWLSVFLESYRHFPKMEKQKRLMMSVGNATLLALMLVVLVIVSLWLLDLALSGGL